MTKNSHFSPNLACELVYAPAKTPVLLFSNPWAEGMTAGTLILASGWTDRYPEISELAVGIFSQCVKRDTLLKPGDRVELYRPLLVDPKEKRRHKAKK